MSNVKVTGGDLLVLIVRYLLCLVFPPLAVFDKGCGTMLLVLLFTLFGWLPGTVLAFLICIKDRKYYQN
ncbi:MAG: YqaE/Pmp3 family membrane protein [Lentisphaeria bacterium]|nr:YqaE/Pmp3 family membrane protein [Lentisphaeria bacterium]